MTYPPCIVTSSGCSAREYRFQVEGFRPANQKTVAWVSPKGVTQHCGLFVSLGYGAIAPNPTYMAFCSIIVNNGIYLLMIEYKGILHASVVVADTERALSFYRDVLGLAVNPDRPEMKYGGAWLDIGPQQIHLLELPNPDPVTGRPEHVGRDRHTALGVNNVDALVKRLDEAGVAYTLSRSGRRALFCRDPDGNGLEFIES